MVEIILRTPCTFHRNCDETAVYILHGRSSRQGPLTDEEWEKTCCICEGIMSKIKQSFLSTGKWTCPVCGFIHTVDVVNRGPVTPALSFWYKVLKTE